LPEKEAKNRKKEERGGRRKSSWKKGQSGNPHGRPKKGETFSDIIRELAEASDIRTSSGERIKRKRAVVEKIYSKAIQEGDFPSIRFLIERVDPPAGTEPGDGPSATASQVWAAVIALVRKATENHPEVRAKIVKEINAAYPGD
jgi:hypothetical protein